MLATQHPLLTTGNMPKAIRDTAAVGSRVRAIRESKGLDQEQLADQSGLSRAYVSRLENGAIPSPKLYDLANIADALGTTVSQLTEPVADTASLRALLASVIPPERAGILDDVVAEIADWQDDDQQLIVELFRNQVFNWPRRRRAES